MTEKKWAPGDIKRLFPKAKPHVALPTTTFDGTYWANPSSLKRSRPERSSEELDQVLPLEQVESAPHVPPSFTAASTSCRLGRGAAAGGRFRRPCYA